MSDEHANGRKSTVFISHPRKDKLFVRKLNDALNAAGISAWVDWEGIPFSSDWMAEITRAVQGADAFLCVISRDNLLLASGGVCALNREHIHDQLVDLFSR